MPRFFDPAVTFEAGRDAPATHRNRDVILEVLQRHLPTHGTVLETASGTGQHITYFASKLPGLSWQPTDGDPDMRQSILDWTQHLGLTNVAPPVSLDVHTPTWPFQSIDALLNINMIHISPWSATESLMRGAAQVLKPNGLLFTYGPYKRDGQHTAHSNLHFDESLRSRDPSWGVRDMEAVQALAVDHGFTSIEVVPMPANNFSLVWQRR